MNKYQDGKIYKLTSKQTDKIYVGSTILILNVRMTGHRTKYKSGNISSIEMLKYDDCIIELIEDYPCNSKKELLEREQHYMDLYKDIIVNKRNSKEICQHNKRRHYCIECNGVGICEHNKQRQYCIECKGAHICEHLKRKNECVICNNIKICIAINTKCNKNPCKYRARPDSDYCGHHTPK
jgi:hypothetical protein